MAFRQRQMYTKKADENFKDLSQKSYLFEFLEKDGTVKQSFLFSLPPESEEIEYTFRTAQTKVFSGLHVDDYGIDAPHIVLSGSTANSRVRKVMVDGSPNYLTGEQEIYKFRDMIRARKSYGGTESPLALPIIMTDLSKTDVAIKGATGAVSTISYSTNQYEVFFNEFKISRDKEKPFTYNYTIDMTAVENNDGHGKEHGEIIGNQKWLDKVLAVCKNVENQVDAINSTVSGFYENITDSVDELRTASLEITRVIGKAMGIFSNAANETSAALTDVSNNLFAIPQDVTGMMLNVADELINSANRFVIAIDNTKEKILSLGTQGYWVPQSMLDKINMDSNELEISARKLANKLDRQRNDTLVSVTRLSGEINIYVETRIAEGGQSVSINNRTYYGSTEYMLKANDTIESLSMNNFGSLDYIEDILMYNKITSLSDLNEGDKIRIPLTSPSQSQAQDIVTYQRGQIDVYGKDIALDADGYVQVAKNDFALTSGVNNLMQAILMRLRDTINHRVRLNTYGIRMSLGGGKEANTYIITSIYNTIIADPRVLRVDSISYRGEADYLIVEVNYTDVNNRLTTMMQKI